MYEMRKKQQFIEHFAVYQLIWCRNTAYLVLQINIDVRMCKKGLNNFEMPLSRSMKKSGATILITEEIHRDKEQGVGIRVQPFR